MNINQIMKQAQKLQQQMAEKQEKMSQVEVMGQSGGGMIHVKLGGDNTVKSINIDASLINPDDKEMLEDLIIAAFNDARSKLDQKMQEEMSDITSGLPLPPGLKFT
jgi:DNA-binding YbaB/EbfC family protein